MNGGRRIGKSNAKSYLELAIHRSSQVPGPSAYGEADYKSKPTTVKFSTAFVPSDVDWCIMRAQELPAPDAYQSKIAKGLTRESPSFSMGNFTPKTEIDFVMARSASMPGPSDYYEGLPPMKQTPLRKMAKQYGINPKKKKKKKV